LEVVTTSYNVMARDRDRGIYLFQGTPLTNACEAILTYESGNLILTIHHRNGIVDTMIGQLVQEGDAPAHTHNPMRREVPVKFAIYNLTGETITFVSMREAADPDKGEVHLFDGTLDNDSSASVDIRLYEEDEAITDWIVYIETEDGITTTSGETFNPWKIYDLDLIINNGVFSINAR
jgi:hypothetical protein